MLCILPSPTYSILQIFLRDHLSTREVTRRNFRINLHT